MMSKYVITPDYVRQILDYYPDTGVFVWKTRPLEHFKTATAHKVWNIRYSGKIAGNATSAGYWQVRINKLSYQAHRLALFYVNGEWPGGHVDHHNGDGLDNRLVNIRNSTLSQNQANAVWKTNTSGRRNVKRQGDKWRARMYVNGKSISLGMYLNFDEAVRAVEEAERIYHGEFAYSARPKDS